jgi:hypothetical protein
MNEISPDSKFWAFVLPGDGSKFMRIFANCLFACHQSRPKGLISTFAHVALRRVISTLIGFWVERHI